MSDATSRQALIAWQLTRRLRQPLANLFAPCVFPLLSFGVVSLAFASVVGRYLHGISYAAYLVPLVIVNTVLFGAAADGADAWRDARAPIVRRLATFDVESRAFAASRALGYGVVCALQAAFFALVLGVSTKLTGSAAGLLATVALVAAFAVGVGALAAGLGFCARAADDVPGLLHAVFLPLTFVSTGYVPPPLFPDGVRWLVAINPISWLAQSVRGLLRSGSPQPGQLLGTLLAAAALCALGLLLAQRSVRPGETR